MYIVDLLAIHLVDCAPEGRLTPSGKSGAYPNHRELYGPRLAMAAGFLFGEGQVAKAVLFCRNLFAAFSSNLTRRANHRHTDIIAKIARPAPATAAGFFIF
jgi:hypothetical protein